jgi:hypothetical protein
MTPDQLGQLDAFLEVLRKHRVAHFEGAVNGISISKLILRDDPQPTVAEQLSKIPIQTPEEMDAVLFHSAPPLPDLPQPPPGMRAWGSEAPK